MEQLKKMGSMYKADSGWMEILIITVLIIVVIALAFAISYGIFYLLVSVLYWAFGPIIFGYAFSHKVVFGTWVSVILIRLIFRRGN